MTTYLALGSNLGDRLQSLRQARERLTTFATGKITSAALYESDPLDCPADSPAFYNTVIAFETGLTPTQLLAETQAIEAALGREAQATRAQNSPRPIDIDLLLCDDLILATPELTLPHPRLHERRFVLHPLRDLAPALIPPTHPDSIAILLKLCESPERPPVRIADSW
jgi:2-amino-4-hydroxy-6-hydroxymethyldihydropteridine diphosphokinase